MTLSTRIAVMNEGVVQQMGTPTEVYEFPRTRYVADFLGSVNLFEGVVAGSSDAEGVVIESDQAGVALHQSSSEKLAAGAKVFVAIRPEKIEISRDEPGQTENRCRGRVEEIAYQGSLSIYRIKLATGMVVRVTLPNHARTMERPVDWDDEVWLHWGRHVGVVLTD